MTNIFGKINVLLGNLEKLMEFSLFGINKPTPPVAMAIGDLALVMALAIAGPYAPLVAVLPHGSEIVFLAGLAGKLLSCFFVHKNA